MSRTTFLLPLLAALAVLSPGKVAAGPPEGASGKMVLDEVASAKRAKYDRIKLGMAEPRVDAILRGWLPEGISICASGHSVDWSGPGGARIHIRFDRDGQVTRKDFRKAGQSLGDKPSD